MFNSSINNQIPTPVGTVIMSPSPTIDGYLLCNGATPNWLLYPKLRAVIGAFYSNKLPDFRGRFIRGAGGSAAVIGTPQADAMQGHKHNYIFKSAIGGTLSGGDPNSVSNTTVQTSTPVTDGVNGTPRIANETRPVNHALNFFIKY